MNKTFFPPNLNLIQKVLYAMFMAIAGTAGAIASWMLFVDSFGWLLRFLGAA